MQATLLLNQDYSPLKIISWQRAVCLLFDNKIEVLEEYDDFDLKSVSVTIKCPAVVRLLSYISPKRHRTKFSRINILSRDFYTCQYCNKQPGVKELTFDHIVPKSRGGKTTWENIITACVTCNHKKKDRTPSEAKMTLLSIPRKPSYSLSNKWMIPISKTPACWRSYLYYSQELENDNETRD